MAASGETFPILPVHYLAFSQFPVDGKARPKRYRRAGFPQNSETAKRPRRRVPCASFLSSIRREFERQAHSLKAHRTKKAGEEKETLSDAPRRRHGALICGTPPLNNSG
jgi:hypothetical protein